MRAEVFLDTSYAIALITPSDSYYESATSIADRIEAEGTHLVTTYAILLEIGNALSKLRYRSAAIRLLGAREADPKVEIVPMSRRLYAQAFKLYKERPDKEWGQTDCVSFVTMQERRITEALTADTHFTQAGYHAMLRE